MKSIITLIALCFALSASAQQASTQPVKHNVVDVAVAMIFGAVVRIGAAATGNTAALCTRLGGVYIPANAPDKDVCPGGQWSNLFINHKG